MQDRSKHILGDLLLFIVALIWGFGFVAVKLGLNSGVGPFSLLSYRFTIGALCLLPFAMKDIRKKMPLISYKRGILLGVFMFLGFAFQTFGLAYTTTAKNAFLTGANVVIVPLIAYFLFKRDLPLRSIVATILTFIGIGFLTMNNDISINIGDILTLICALMFALHISFTSEITQNEPAIFLVFIQMLTSMVLSWLFTLLFDGPDIPNLTSIWTILYLGIFSTCLAFFFQTVGQRYAHPAKAAIILSTESLFGAILGVIIFGDIMTIKMTIGALIIFSAIVLTEYQGKKIAVS